MLQIKQLCKEYRTGDLVQKALDHVDLNLRDNEFVAILGPSGSGKTTLLNIIGGLDRYDSGNLIINGISTKKYKDRDWDSYRNHTIGFVFQSYNLIPHQTILANVELALTISGIGKSERRKKAQKALEEVGLGEQIHKKPNQLSGGQMQRVAIARALVNDPDILLADEPTGALDSATSVQVMELLKKVAEDRLVVMVTHNPELAEQYATRIVNLRDGKIRSDSDPFILETAKDELVDVLAGHWPESYNECVLVLTSGGGISDFMLYTLGLRDSMELDDMIQQFIDGENVDTPEDIGSYTYEDILGITFKLVDSEDYYEYDSDYHVWTDKSDNKTYMKKLVKKGEDIRIVGIVQPKEDANGTMLNSGIAYPTSLTKHVVENAANSEIVKKQLADRKTNVFTDEPFGETEDNGFNTDSLFQVDEKAFEDIFQFDTDSMMDGSNFDISDMFGGNSTSIDFADMLDTDKMQLKLPDMKEIDMGELIKSLDLNVSASDISTIVSNLMEGYGDYAATHPEADYSNLGEQFVQYLSTDSARSILSEHLQDILTDNNAFTVSEEDIQALFREVLTGYQSYAESKGYTDPDKFDEYLMEYLQTDACKNIIHQWGNQIIQNSGEVTISEDQLKSLATALASGYQSYAKETGAPDPSDMGTHFQNYLASEDAQNRLTSSLTALVDTDKLKKSLTESLGSSMGQMTQAYSEQIQSLMTDVITQIVDQMGNSMVQAMQQWMTQLGNSMGDMMKIDADALAGAFSMNMDFDELTDLMTSMSAARSATYENNLRTLGYADFDEPSSIEIYPLDFESKEHVVEILDDYNEQMEATGKDEQVITYTDMVGTLMSSVTDIVDIISYVLIAFVAISLVVSSIMIGVITYISVLERKKEIGILRAIGASKGNISQVFNAETFIIGLCAGLIGIGLTLIMLIPGNALIHYLAGTNNINASLSPVYAIILILLSIGLTLLGGLIPSKKAAKSDPVTALRTE